MKKEPEVKPKPEIEIEIKPDGTFSFGVKGVKGKKCKELTKFLEEIGEVIKEEVTPEYYQCEEPVIQEEHIKVEKK